MANLEVIELYGSPFSERLRWALTYKQVPHTRRPFVPLVGEEEHRRATGIATAPVLLCDGTVVGDSNRALEWLDDYFAAKYHWSETEEQRALGLLADVLPDVARAVADGCSMLAAS